MTTASELSGGLLTDGAYNGVANADAPLGQGTGTNIPIVTNSANNTAAGVPLINLYGAPSSQDPTGMGTPNQLPVPGSSPVAPVDYKKALLLIGVAIAAVYAYKKWGRSLNLPALPTIPEIV